MQQGLSREIDSSQDHPCLLVLYVISSEEKCSDGLNN